MTESHATADATSAVQKRKGDGDQVVIGRKVRDDVASLIPRETLHSTLR